MGSASSARALVRRLTTVSANSTSRDSWSLPGAPPGETEPSTRVGERGASPVAGRPPWALGVWAPSMTPVSGSGRGGGASEGTTAQVSWDGGLKPNRSESGGPGSGQGLGVCPPGCSCGVTAAPFTPSPTEGRPARSPPAVAPGAALPLLPGAVRGEMDSLVALIADEVARSKLEVRAQLPLRASRPRHLTRPRRLRPPRPSPPVPGAR